MRLARPEDGPAARELVRRAFAHYVPRIGLRPRPMDDDYEQFARREELWVHGEPIDAVLVLQNADDHLWLDVIAVDLPAQGTGLGRALMAFAEEEAARRGYREVRLLTNEQMTENRAFYAALSYEEYDVRGEHGTSRVYLRKRLPG